MTPVLLMVKASEIVAVLLPDKRKAGVGPNPVPLLAKLTTVSDATKGMFNKSKDSPPSTKPCESVSIEESSVKVPLIPCADTSTAPPEPVRLYAMPATDILVSVTAVAWA